MVTVMPLAAAAGRYTGADVVYPNHSVPGEPAVGQTTAFRSNAAPDGHGDAAHDHLTSVDDHPDGAVVVEPTVVEGAPVVLVAVAVGSALMLVDTASVDVDSAGVDVDSAGVVVDDVASEVVASGSVVGAGGGVVDWAVVAGAGIELVVAGSVVSGCADEVEGAGSVGTLADA